MPILQSVNLQCQVILCINTNDSTWSMCSKMENNMETYTVQCEPQLHKSLSGYKECLWQILWGRRHKLKLKWNTVLLLSLAVMLRTIPVSDAMTMCPGLCSCSSNRFPGFTVECVQKELSAFPSIPFHTINLKLSENSISHIENHTLNRLSSLVTLFLDRNRISAIEPGAFRHVPKVQILNLRRNRIVRLDSVLFSHLRELESLDLGENRIVILHPNTFIHNHRLTSLSLDSNSIRNIHNGSFHSQYILKKLSLQRNPVSQLNPGVFDSQRGLEELSLSHMHLDTIQSGTFKNQIYLRSLDLAANRMATVYAKPFENLKDLQYFNISGNPLSCDCELIPLQVWLMDSFNQRLEWTTNNIPLCFNPPSVKDLILFEVPQENMTCSTQPLGSMASNTPKQIPKPKPNKNKSKLGPLVYDPMMGWYTASTLTGMLVLFLICVALDKLKRKFYKWRRMKRKLKEQHQYEFCGDKAALDGDLISLKLLGRTIPPRQSSRDSTRTNRSTQSAPIWQRSVDSDTKKARLIHQTSFDSRLLHYPVRHYRQASQDSQSSQDSSRLLPLSLQHSQLIRQASGESYWTAQSSQDSGSVTRQSSQDSAPSLTPSMNLRPISAHGHFVRAASFDARSRTASVDHSSLDGPVIPSRLGIHGHLMRASSFDARAIMRQPSIDGGQILKAYSQEAFRRQFSVETPFTRQESLDVPYSKTSEPSNLNTGLSQSHDSPLGKSQLFGPIFIKRKGSDSPLRRQSSSSQESTTQKIPIARPEKLPVMPHGEGLPISKPRPLSPLVRQESLGTYLNKPSSPLLQQALKSPLMKQRSHESPFLQVQVQPRRSSLVRQRSHELPLAHTRPVSPLAQPPRDLNLPSSCQEDLVHITTYPRGNTLTVSPLRHHMTPPTSPGIHPDYSSNTLMVSPCRPPSSPTPRVKRPSQDSLPRGMSLHLPEIVIQVFDHSDSPSQENNVNLDKRDSLL